MTGERPADVDGRRLDRLVVGRSLVFVATFSLIFILLGLGATAIGSVLSEKSGNAQQDRGRGHHRHGRAVHRLALHHPAQPRVASGRLCSNARAAAARWSPARPSRSRGPPASGPPWAPSPARLDHPGRPPRSNLGCSACTPPGLALPFLFSAVAFTRLTPRLRLLQAPPAAVQDISRPRLDRDGDARPHPMSSSDSTSKPSSSLTDTA